MRAGDSFKRKVEVLETWAAAGEIPKGQKIPSGPVELGRWESSELGLTKWTSPNIASPKGPYPELRVRFDRVVERLCSPGKNTKIISARIAREGRIYERQLAEQLCLLTQENEYLRIELELATSSLRLSEDREAALRKKLQIVVPIQFAKP